jgi:hypothetical protein
VQSGARTIDRRSDVMVGGSTLLPLDQLPLGSDTFSGAAYGTACNAIDGTQPTWTAAATNAFLSAGQRTLVTLVFEPTGSAGVCARFDDGTDGGGCALSSDGGVVGLSCNALLSCAAAATTQAALQNCFAMGTPNGAMLFKAVQSCVAAQCGGIMGSGTATCSSSIPACESCITTGTSPTGNTPFGACTSVAGMVSNPPTMDPKCGACVDQLSACSNDK